MTIAWLVLLVIVVALLAAWMSWTANRLDRLHHRVDVAHVELHLVMLRRSGAAAELASAEELDPASRLLLYDAAHQARTEDSSEFEVAESALSQVLRQVLDAETCAELRATPAGAEMLDELADLCRRVELARRFHNDVVTSARALRSRRRVRLFRLAGHAAPLRTVELDDVPPAALAAA